MISGNAYDGLKSTGSITIEGNFVGTDATGNVGLGNGTGFGLACQGAANAAITVIISDNVVSANKESGVSVSPGSQSSSTFTITNNLIGTNAAGTAALGNSAVGLQLVSVENATVLDNVISGNNLGVQLSGFGSDIEHNVIQGNLIGTDKTGLVDLGNAEGGMAISAAIGNEIGGTGPGQGNVIAFNGDSGVSVSGGEQDEFTQNSIFGNEGPGIYISGESHFVPAPAVTFTPGAGGNGTLAGTLTGIANETYDVEIFSNPSVPPVGQEQGKTFIQDVPVSIGSSGKGSFSVTEPQGIYTVTATDPDGDTSPFSNAVGGQALAATTTVVSSSINPSTVGQEVTFTAVVSASGSSDVPTGTVSFAIDGTSETPSSLHVVGGEVQASFSISTLSAGTHTISASYSGDPTFAASTVVAPLQQTVDPLTTMPVSTTTTIVSSADPSAVARTVTFTAAVTAAGSAGVPTGTVTFTIDGKTEPPAALNVVDAKDEASFSISTLSAGKHSVSASYSGDSTHETSAVAIPLSQTVVAPAVVTPPPVVPPPATPPTVAPPTVKLVQRFGVHMQPTVVMLTFSSAPGSCSRKNIDNYVIVDPSGKNVAIASAVYDSADFTVTLRPSEKIQSASHVSADGAGHRRKRCHRSRPRTARRRNNGVAGAATSRRRLTGRTWCSRPPSRWCTVDGGADRPGPWPNRSNPPALKSDRSMNWVPGAKSSCPGLPVTTPSGRQECRPYEGPAFPGEIRRMERAISSSKSGEAISTGLPSLSKS